MEIFAGKNIVLPPKSQYFYLAAVSHRSMRQFFNWKTSLSLIALLFVVASLSYTNQLAHRLAEEEKKKVQQLAFSIKTLATATNNDEVSFAQTFVSQNNTIPLIITDEKERISDYKNIDTKGERNVKKFLKEKLHLFKEMHEPIVAEYEGGRTFVFYGESNLLYQLKLFPYVQMTIIFLFLILVIVALTAANRSMQNRVWVGLSKETAHQLGTPLTSIEAWMELLKESGCNHETVVEMQKDLDRLKLVADRFSKVGSEPQLLQENVVARVREMVDYMQKRSPKKVTISLHVQEEDVETLLSGPLFDWVLENLIRNALDAMEGKGNIIVNITNHPYAIWIDVKDDGKGIPKHLLNKIFRPGFSTKKRGWGLGLSLSKRIIEKYHHGSLLVKHTEVGKGTTFRIVLRR
jgi:chemotaxis protein histidine kinase CheA